MSTTEDNQTAQDLAEEIEALRERQREQAQTIEQLRQEKQELEQQVEDVQKGLQIPKPTRRQLLKAGGASAAALIWGSAATGNAAAAMGDDPTIGSDSQRYDWYVETLDANTVDTDEAEITNLGGRGESTSNQSIANATATTVEIDASDFEDDASNIVDVDTTNNKLVAKKGGVKYDLKGTAKFDTNLGDGTRVQYNVVVNGTAVARAGTALGADEIWAGGLSDVKELSANDEITHEVYHESGGSADLSANELTSLAATVEG